MKLKDIFAGVMILLNLKSLEMMGRMIIVITTLFILGQNLVNPSRLVVITIDITLLLWAFNPIFNLMKEILQEGDY